MVLGRLLRDGEAKTLKRLRTIANHINDVEDTYIAMSDDELREQTAAFKERIAKGRRPTTCSSRRSPWCGRRPSGRWANGTSTFS